MKTLSEKEKQYFEDLVQIAKNYKIAFERDPSMRIDVNAICDWNKMLNIVEMNAWSYIRNFGLPMFPQYPVEKYYADFADPVKKIVIEIDGKTHRTPEGIKNDFDRDNLMNSKGWHVFRISARMCLSENEGIPLDNEFTYHPESAEYVFWRIKKDFYENAHDRCDRCPVNPLPKLPRYP